MLAGDYVKGDWLLANMEAGDVSGRHAANAVIQQFGSHESQAQVFDYYHPPEWYALKQRSTAIAAGMAANRFDVPLERVLGNDLGDLVATDLESIMVSAGWMR